MRVKKFLSAQDGEGRQRAKSFPDFIAVRGLDVIPQSNMGKLCCYDDFTHWPATQAQGKDREGGKLKPTARSLNKFIETRATKPAGPRHAPPSSSLSLPLPSFLSFLPSLFFCSLSSLFIAILYNDYMSAISKNYCWKLPAARENSTGQPLQLFSLQRASSS